MYLLFEKYSELNFKKDVQEFFLEKSPKTYNSINIFKI